MLSRIWKQSSFYINKDHRRFTYRCIHKKSKQTIDISVTLFRMEIGLFLDYSGDVDEYRGADHD